MPGRTAAINRTRSGRLQHLYPGCVPLEWHVLIVCRLHQYSVTNLREVSLANVLVEEHFLVDETEVVLNLRNVTGSAEDALVRIELRRTLADLRRRLSLRLTLEGNRINRAGRRILNRLGIELLLLQAHLRKQRQILLLLKPHILAEYLLRLGKTHNRLHSRNILSGITLPWRIFLVEGHLEFSPNSDFFFNTRKTAPKSLFCFGKHSNTLQYPVEG